MNKLRLTDEDRKVAYKLYNECDWKFIDICKKYSISKAQLLMEFYAIPPMGFKYRGERDE